MKIRKILHKIKKLFFPAPLIIKESNSYSQAGEDAVLSFLFTDKKVINISYLDIGTNLPDNDNNTYLFYKRGCRGVCVEADRTLISEIQTKRPGDKIIHAGVSVDNQKESDFYIFNLKGLNTFDRDEAERRSSSGVYKIDQVEKVPLITINKILEDYFSSGPDLLSIDIEGSDLKVLKSLDFNKYPIPVICVETCMYSENHVRPKDTTIAEFLITKGYEAYADTYINTIFVNKRWFYGF